MKGAAQESARSAVSGTSRRASAGRLPPHQRELLVRLDHLRSVAREIARSYLANLEHDIIDIRESVGGVRDGDGRKAKLRRNTIDRMGEILDDLTLKPHKGRRSDFKKVEKAIRALQRLLAKQSMAAPRNRR